MAKRKCPFRETKCSLSILGYYYNNWYIQLYNENDYGTGLYYSEKTSSSRVLYTFGLLLDGCYHEQACCDSYNSGRRPFHAIRFTSQTPRLQWPKQWVIRQWGHRIVNTSWSCSNTFFKDQKLSPHYYVFLVANTKWRTAYKGNYANLFSRYFSCHFNMFMHSIISLKIKPKLMREKFQFLILAVAIMATSLARSIWVRRVCTLLSHTSRRLIYPFNVLLKDGTKTIKLLTS